MVLQPYQQRVVDEKKELDDKREKLWVFTHNGTFRNLPRHEQELLTEQQSLVQSYSAVLGRRISHFEAEARDL